MFFLLAFSFFISLSENFTITYLSAIQTISTDEASLTIEYK